MIWEPSVARPRTRSVRFVFDPPGLLGPTLRPEPFDAPLTELLVAMGERVLGETAAR